jgi:hypothetical protein
MSTHGLVQRLAPPLVALALILASVAHAQTTPSNPALVASIAFLNLFDPTVLPAAELSLPVEQRSDTNVVRVAFNNLVARDILDPAVANGMLNAITLGRLPATLLAIFVLDLATGSAPLGGVLAGLGIGSGGTVDLDQALADAAGQGASFFNTVTNTLPPGLSLPPVSADGSVSLDAVTSTVEAILSNPDALDGIRSGYEDAISPLAP